MQGRVLVPFLLEAAAIVAVASGDAVRSSRMAGAAAMCEQMATPCPPAWMREVSRWLDQARAAVGPEASARAWADGLRLGVEDAVAEALADRPRADDGG